MCKSNESKAKAMDNFFAKLRGEPYSEPRAIYARDLLNGGDDLIGFAAFFEGVLTFFRVMPDESVRCDGRVLYPAMGDRGIAAYYGGDYAAAI